MLKFIKVRRPKSSFRDNVLGRKLMSVPVVLKRTHPKNEQNHSSTLRPQHLNLVDILRNVFTSKISSRFFLAAVWIVFYNLLV